MKALTFFAIALCATAVAQESPFKTTKEPEPFANLESIAAVVPEDINLKSGGKWSVVGVEKANTAITTNVQNRPAKLRLKVQVFEPYKADGWGYRMMAPDTSVTIHGTKVFCRTWAYFRPEMADALAKVHKGSTVTLSGTLGRADLAMYNGQPGLSLDLWVTKVEEQ